MFSKKNYLSEITIDFIATGKTDIIQQNIKNSFKALNENSSSKWKRLMLSKKLLKKRSN